MSKKANTIYLMLCIPVVMITEGKNDILMLIWEHIASNVHNFGPLEWNILLNKIAILKGKKNIYGETFFHGN